MSTAIPETPVILYQYRICPFSNIAKTVLTYQQIPFQSIEVNPLTKAELKFSSDYRKVPIVTSPQSQEQWNGTEEILKRFSGSEDSSFGNSQSSMRWQDFARDKLAPLLYPNLCNTLSSSFRAFEYVHSTPSFSMAQKYSIQYIGSLAMYFAAGKIKKKYGLDDVRVALDEALVELESGLKESAASSSLSKTRFLNHSESPHLGDLAVFGVLKGLEGLPILEDILQDDRYPTIRDWFSAMNGQIESKRMVR
jgi:microsomal prostaglandin-E synthase 2